MSSVATRARLVTLGRLALVGPDGAEEPSLQKRRRKLAVLAVLAVEARPLSRDLLVEMFWGEQDEARARHSLSDALSHLRRVLGRDAIVVGRAEVALTPDAALEIDAVQLVAAAAAGDHERVAALYTGPFLDGVYVGGSATFEHWVERSRARLHALAIAGYRERCATYVRARAWTQCADTAAAWLDVEPLSADAAVCRLRALAAPDTADALRAAVDEFHSIAARLAREFEMEPAAPVRTLAAELRARLAALPAPAHVEPAPPLPAAPAVTHAAAEEPRVVPLSAPRVASPLLSRRLAIWGAAAAIVLAAGVTGVVRARASVALAPNRVAVLPFEVHGGAEVAFLRRGMVDLLSTNLDGAGELRSVDPRAVLGALGPRDSVVAPARGREVARRVGAGLYVVGEVVEAGDALRVGASLYDSRRGVAIAQASALGAPSELFRIVDRVTAQLLARRAGTPAERLQRLAALTTPSLPALKAYLQGEEHYRVARYSAAFEAFQRAVAEDSAFALAHYRLAKTATWAGIWPWDSIVARSARAVRDDQRLTWRAKLVIEAFDAWMRGASDDAERRYRQVLASSPDDVEAWYELGEVLFHCNPLRGRPSGEARAAFERVLAVEPSHRGALVHLVRIAADERKREEVDSLVTRAVGVSGEDWALELRAFRAWALGDSAEQARLVPQLRTAQDALLERTIERVATHAGDVTGADALVPLLAAPPRSAEVRGRALATRATLAVMRGRWDDADRHLRASALLTPEYALIERARLASAPLVTRPRAELLALRDTLERWDGHAPLAEWPPLATYNGLYPLLRTYLIGVLGLRVGDLAGAERSARFLESEAGRGGPVTADAGGQARELARGLADGLRGQVAAARGDRAAAFVLLERARVVVAEGLLEMSIGSQARERWTRAELLRESGRLREALPWYASLPANGVQVGEYLVPSHLRQAEILERLGDRRGAASHRAIVASLWRDAEPEMRRMVGLR